ncbi:MAG: zf-HC2 domain-containing protein [Proteobacteria bacterium]|nr:zf-HC2 domain-containing protein [Pseudomonadota bacterium]
MKTCQQIAELASQYVDGELSMADWGQVRMHLWLCPPCRAYADQIAMTRQVLEQLPAEAVSEDVKSELVGRFRDWVDAGAPCDEDPEG